MSDEIQLQHDEWFYASDQVKDAAIIKDYDAVAAEASENPEAFWAKRANELEWYAPWKQVLDRSQAPFFKWFVGAKTNIVHNAIKFTPGEGRIVVSASADENKVTVAVADSGIGIVPNDLTRIFERFFKTDRSRAVGGTGLGLAIAKHIVQAHGGRLWATSYEGKGSTFYFTMPREEPDPEPQAIDGSAVVDG